MVWIPFLTVVPFGFKAVSFHFTCHSTDAKKNCREVENRKAKTDIGKQLCKWVGSHDLPFCFYGLLVKQNSIVILETFL